MQKDAEACQAAKRQRKLVEASNTAGLTRVASVFCADLAQGSNQRFAQAEIYLSVAEVPRWSKRYQASAKPKLYSVGTVALQGRKALGIWQ
jgi:hypothetical protein